MSKLKNTITRLLYPERCPYCDSLIEINKITCDDCAEKIPVTYCENYAKGGYPCCSPFFYKGVFKDAVIRFKFKNHHQNSKKLSYALSEAIKKAYDTSSIDIITFVPMFPSKEKDRGYNQSELLAVDTAKLLNIPCIKLLEKIKDNNPQHECLTQAKRRDNVKGAYKAVNTENIKGKRVLIIDDIITTGYTLGECCRLISRKTKAEVLCATLCAKNNIYT